MSFELVKLSVAHNSVINVSDLHSVISEGETEVTDLDEKIEELQDEISVLKDEIEDLKTEIKDIEGDQENALPYDRKVNQSVIDVKENQIELKEFEIKEKESKIEEHKSEKVVWQADIDHIQSVIDEAESYRADTLICANHIDDHIKGQFDESELEDVSTVIKSNINWDGVVEDCKQDYAYLDLDGCEYHYLCS